MSLLEILGIATLATLVYFFVMYLPKFIKQFKSNKRLSKVVTELEKVEKIAAFDVGLFLKRIGYVSDEDFDRFTMITEVLKDFYMLHFNILVKYRKEDDFRYKLFSYIILKEIFTFFMRFSQDKKDNKLPKEVNVDLVVSSMRFMATKIVAYLMKTENNFDDLTEQNVSGIINTILN